MAKRRNTPDNSETAGQNTLSEMKHCPPDSHQPLEPPAPSVNFTAQEVFQVIYIHGLDAINAGEFQKAVEWLSVVHCFDASYKDTSARLNEAKKKLAKSKQHLPDWAYLGALLGTISVFLGAFFENTLTLALSFSKLAGALIWLLYLVLAVAVILWAKREGLTKSLDQSNEIS